MSKIDYNYYSDIDAVAELMVKNNFGMGKYNKSLNGYTFSHYQKEKGFVFGIVGKLKDEIVTYVAGYKVGSNRIANEKQIIMGSLIIDSKYRTAVYSISEMFRMLLAKVTDLGYNELIAEVNTNNTASLSMMRKTGFILLDSEPTIYGEYVLHNYIPSIIRCIQNDSAPIDNTTITKGILSLNKSLKENPFISKNVVSTKWKLNNKIYEFCINVIWGNVVGAYCEKAFKISQITNNKFFFSEL